MTQRRTRRIAIVVFVLTMLAVIAWWRWPVAQALSQAEFVTHARDAVEPAQRQQPPSRDKAFDRRSSKDSTRVARCGEDQDLQIRARREQLRFPRTADEAIQHALLNLFSGLHSNGDFAGAGSEFLAARRRWPDNLDLAWFSLRNCVESYGCDPDDELRHLLAFDPDNAAVWMLVMAASKQRNDEAGYDQALRRAASAKIYDPRVGITYLHVRHMLEAVPTPASCMTADNISELRHELGREPKPDDWADLLAGSMEMAVGMPSWTGLSWCSKKARALSATRRRDCIALLTRVADGDTLMEQALALGLLVQLTDDGPDGAQWRERYRRLRWLMTLPMPATIPENYFMRVWADGEVATLQARAVAQGRWPPPLDWLPSDTCSRALIQTGRLPPERH